MLAIWQNFPHQSCFWKLLSSARARYQLYSTLRHNRLRILMRFACLLLITKADEIKTNICRKGCLRCSWLTVTLWQILCQKFLVVIFDTFLRINRMGLYRGSWFTPKFGCYCTIREVAGCNSFSYSYLFICWNIRVGLFLLCYYSIASCTSKGYISDSAIRHLWRFYFWLLVGI